MTVKKLDWDSDFFSLIIGEISIQPTDEKKIIVPDYFDLIYTKQTEPFDFDVEGYSQTFSEHRLVYAKTYDEKQEFDETGVLDYDKDPIPAEDLYELAFVCGGHSRFLLDERFGRENFQRLYIMWIDKCLTKERADKIFYVIEEGKVVGFLTLLIDDKEKTATMTLLAVDETIQNRGIGKRLFTECDKFCQENSIKKILLSTQKINTTACRYYDNKGYEIEDESIIKHFWKI